MHFKNIRIRQFRNYEEMQLPLHPGFNVFVGENGQGKTNLLEALYFLTKGHSFRPGKTNAFINQAYSEDQKIATLEAALVRDQRQDSVRLAFQPNKKTFFLNQKRVSSSQLVQRFPSVLFSPESLAAVKEGPDARRQLLDDLVVSHSLQNAQLLASFRKCLRARNRLLRGIKNEEYSLHQGRTLKESLDQSFLTLATQLTWVRLQGLKSIAQPFEDAFHSITTSINVDISVVYEISGRDATQWTMAEVGEALSQRLSELQRAEMDSGLSLVGPQKHDIRFLFADQDSRYYCSQGQQRALILAFKMAQIMYHYGVHEQHPVLLLDDVLSELDEKKRANLIEFLKGIRSQIFLTTTDLSFPHDFQDKDLSVYEIIQGKITPGQ